MKGIKTKKTAPNNGYTGWEAGTQWKMMICIAVLQVPRVA